MGLNNEAAAALIYLVLYAIVFVLLILGYITRSLKLRSRYTVLTFHVTVRLAAQATGLAFGIAGTNPNLLIAYFVLGGTHYFIEQSRVQPLTRDSAHQPKDISRSC